MRTEKEIYDLILDIAQKDERIRAVYMNGSRTDPNAPKDIFQDFDIVYVVTETASFISDEKWINAFGNLIMIQEPDKNDKPLGANTDFDNSYGYLMLFTDGYRIDLHIEAIETMIERYTEDKLAIPLLDKDKLLPNITSPTDMDYWVKKPTESLFISCCNDYWWCLQNVGKGIWRDELPYAKQMFEFVIRVRLDEMVSWWIGIKNDFRVSTGKMGKYFKKYLPEPLWEMYKKTYSDYNYKNFWSSIFFTCELFRTVAKDVAEHLLFPYPIDDDKRMTKFLEHIRQLPADAQGIY
ncbi:aminoglycoside 6-adenylyltransferase [Oceanobacillus damuensis]|uniref:aminoglycoside 6-adenylyltransferase n=1 Tax=Oceanobacillus damuensis TaxID=937928 RepID=UPI00082B6C8A|nr:aminoglycoside 6-adenylyltransferase [Oceanobacillus damuensis]